MVAIAYTTDITPAAQPAARATHASKRLEHRPAGDPLIDATTRLLNVPLQQVYALLWRAGVLVVDS